jgi:hypothetical protein
LFDCAGDAAADGEQGDVDIVGDKCSVFLLLKGRRGRDGRMYVDLSVHIVPVIAAGFTFVFAGAGTRCTRVGTASTVAAKREMTRVSCILNLGSTAE